jgi:hypothetical protein
MRWSFQFVSQNCCNSSGSPIPMKTNVDSDDCNITYSLCRWQMTWNFCRFQISRILFKRQKRKITPKLQPTWLETQAVVLVFVGIKTPTTKTMQANSILIPSSLLYGTEWLIMLVSEACSSSLWNITHVFQNHGASVPQP